MNVRLPDVAFEILERQLVLDSGRIVLADPRLEGAGGGRGDGVGRFFEPVEELAELASPWSLNTNVVVATARMAVAAIVSRFIPASQSK